jgi:hypothetical protein
LGRRAWIQPLASLWPFSCSFFALGFAATGVRAAYLL